MGLTQNIHMKAISKECSPSSSLSSIWGWGRGLPRNITHPNGQRLSMTPFHSLFAPISPSSPPTKLDKTAMEKLLIFSGSSPNRSWVSSPSMWSLTQSFWQSYYSSGLSTRWKKQRWIKSFLVIMDKSYLLGNLNYLSPGPRVLQPHLQRVLRLVDVRGGGVLPHLRGRGLLQSQRRLHHSEGAQDHQLEVIWKGLDWLLFYFTWSTSFLGAVLFLFLFSQDYSLTIFSLHVFLFLMAVS